jgi:diadenosine tetraphosphatase ApaH/serine/threonine PP2A family protein phosphatase
MRVLVISDIHANLEALETVLATTEPYDAAWCLGDLVGYGPDPNQCVERVRALPGLVCLVGNHDKAVLGEIDLNTFNFDAQIAIDWARGQCTAATLSYLRRLPAQDRQGEYTLVHGSPRQPVWEYILDCYVAQDNFPLIDTRYCLVGHTHVPVVFREINREGQCVEAAPNIEKPLSLGSDRMIINPGSVGQPRDNNPAASYAILDTTRGEWQFHRVPYNVAATQNRMRAANLPDRLVARLAAGW